jgi:sugar/nucleoside kinase (ribokinase family)
MAKTILVAGTMAFDTLETPFGKRERILGGSANFFSIAASNFTKVELSSILGSDFPKAHIEYLNTRGIGTSNTEWVEGKSFHWVARYEGTMNEAETLETHLNILPDYSPKFNEAAKKCEILFLANFHPEKQLHAIEDAKVVICDTIQFWIQNNFEDLKKVLKKTNVFIINEAEARMISGKTNILHAAKEIVSMGPRTLIIKRGEYGSFLYREGEKLFYAPAYPLLDVIDPTGAGDTFAGGFSGYLSTRPDPLSIDEIKKAMLYGAVTASFTVQGFGIEAISKATRPQIDKRYNELLEMISL